MFHRVVAVRDGVLESVLYYRANLSRSEELDLKTLKKTIHTYKDWELNQVLELLEEGERKAALIERELWRRMKERRDGTYVDQTVTPKTPVRLR